MEGGKGSTTPQHGIGAMRLRHCDYHPRGILRQLREVFERLTRSDSSGNAQAWFPRIATGMAIAASTIDHQEGVWL
jgi:hypothetical protein